MNIPNIYVHSLMTYPPDQGCICFMVKVTPCRSISAKALTSAAASFLIYVPRMKPPCYGNPDGSAGYVPISWICTAGEIGALLLEARLIKEQQPLFNKRLRRNRQLCALQLNEKRVDVVYAKEVDFSRAPNLFGLFANRRAALQALQTIADEQKLCYGLLGLEPLSRGRACFRSALKRCAGACCGKESHEEHALRLRQSLERLRVVCWPWQGAVALKEQHPEMTQYHIIQNWLWLGAVNSLEEATTLIRTPAGFDHDGYKILCKPLLSGNYEITELDPANDQRAS